MKRLLWAGLGFVALLAKQLWPPAQQTLDPESALRRRWMRRAIVAVVVLGLAALSVLVGGVVPVKASSGHWAPTAWFLQFAKRRSVATHARGLDSLALQEPWLVLKGAGHYETGCRPCHGAPGTRQPRIARALTPQPPALSPRIGQWTPEELFYIVKHGIKFTGMPAWPTQHRDDEVRAMVAFLLDLPRLDAGQYQRLVHGGPAVTAGAAPLMDLTAPATTPPPALASCSRCHGKDGQGRAMAAFPRLAGQHENYLRAAMEAFANDRRASGIMQPIAAGLSQVELRELARYYARLPAQASPPGQGSAARGAAEEGREIALRGLPEQRVPACRHCHGPAAAPRNPAYPRLAGQFADYLVLQLELLKAGRRGGSDHAHVMRRAAAGLGRDEMQAVAAYYASLPPAMEAREP
jgi:cytochrome c553